jgi:hypothetical protein
MSWLVPINRFVRRLPVLAAVACLAFAPAAQAVEGRNWLTGPALVRKLDSSQSVAWAGRGLRDALSELSAVHTVAILLDRRVDPGQPLDVSFQQTPLGEVLESVAEQGNLALSRFGPVIVLGPREATRRLRTVAELRRADLARLTPAARSKWARSRAWQWDDLATPQELLERIASDVGARIENLDVVPHDLWAGADLPPLTLSDRLTLVLWQFDLTFELINPQGDFRLVSIPDEVAVERSYPAGRQAEERADELRKRLPGARIRVEGTKVVVQGLVEEQELVDDAAAQARPAAQGTENLESLQLTLTVKQIPLSEVLNKLQQQLGLELRIDRAKLAAAGHSLDERVSFEVKGASLDATLRAALSPAGLTFRRSGKQVEIVPDQPR